MNSTPTSLQIAGAVLKAFDMTRLDMTRPYKLLNGRTGRRARAGENVAHACEQWASAAALLFGVPACSCVSDKGILAIDPLLAALPHLPPPGFLACTLHLHGIQWDRARGRIAADPTLRLAFFRYAIVNLASLLAIHPDVSWCIAPVAPRVEQSPIRRALTSIRRQYRTQAALAQDLRVAEDTVRRWKTGGACPSYDHLADLAERAGIDPEDLQRQLGLWRLAEQLRRMVGHDEFNVALEVFQKVYDCRRTRATQGHASARVEQVIAMLIMPTWTWFVREDILPHEARNHAGEVWEADVRRVQALLREGIRPGSFDFDFVGDLAALHKESISLRGARVA